MTSPDRFLKTFTRAPLTLDPPTSMTWAPPPMTRVTSAAPPPGRTGSYGGERGTLPTEQVGDPRAPSDPEGAVTCVLQGRSHVFSPVLFAV